MNLFKQACIPPYSFLPFIIQCKLKGFIITLNTTLSKSKQNLLFFFFFMFLRIYELMVFMWFLFDSWVFKHQVRYFFFSSSSFFFFWLFLFFFHGLIFYRMWSYTQKFLLFTTFIYTCIYMTVCVPKYLFALVASVLYLTSGMHCKERLNHVALNIKRSPVVFTLQLKPLSFPSCT